MHQNMKMEVMAKTILKLLLCVMMTLGFGSCGKSSSQSQDIQHQNNASLASLSPGQNIQAETDFLSLKSITQRSQYICRARVLKVTAAREQYDPQANLVMSRIQIKILENWKGHLPQKADFRSFGGYLDGLPYFAEEFPRFHEGEEVILFLGDFLGGIFPVGHSAGKITVKDQIIEERGETVSDLKNKILTDFLK